MRTIIATVLFALAPALAGLAADEPQGKVSLETIAEIEVPIAKENGEIEFRRLPAGRVVPGDEVIYTIRAENIGDESVEDVVITDPVPEHMTYSEGTAVGTGASITFSVDGGSTYAVREKLEVTEADGTTRPAAASDYTHIRWMFTDALHPGSSRDVRFRAKLQ